MQVLVVDPEPKRLLDTSRVLQTAGYRVLGAASGSECLRTAKSKGPDLILVDAALPDISGIDLTREIKRDPDLAQVCVVLLSAEPSVAQIRARALENGADGFWLRSLPSREFLAQVGAIVRQKQVQDALRLSLAEWRNVFDAIGDAVYLVDGDHCIVNCNLALAKFLRRPPSEIVGQRCYNLVHEATQPIQGCLHQRAQETRRRETLLTAIGERWFEVTVDPVLDEDDQLVGTVHILSDVTERKRAEDARNQKNAELLQQVQDSQAALARSDESLQVERTGHQQAQESLAQAQAKLERQAQNHLAVLNKSQEALQREVARRQAAEQAQQRSENRLRAAVDSTADLVWEARAESGIVEFCYDARGKLFADPGQFRTLADLEQAIHPEDLARFRAVRQQHLETQGPWHVEYRTVGQDGQVAYWVASGTTLRETEDQPLRLVGVATDVTARLQVERERKDWAAQEQQEQRMVAVSRLAGGMAQEMEQLLAAVLGSSELGLAQVAPSSSLHSNLSAIQKTARSGADLTRRLWAVGRRQVLQLQPVDLHAELVRLEEALRQRSGERVQVQFELADELSPVLADTQALEHILLTLAERARGVMPEGGTLRLETAAVQVDRAYCSRQPQARPGAYARLSVSDSGVALDEAAREHLFEPFSPDSAGEAGGGLGLAMVYGVVKQLDGWVELARQEGTGTRLDFHLPVQAELVHQMEETPAPPEAEEPGAAPVAGEAGSPGRGPLGPAASADALQTAGVAGSREPAAPDADVAAPELLRKVKKALGRGRNRQHER